MEPVEINIMTRGKRNFAQLYSASPSAPNIIFVMTPICSVGEGLVREFLQGLVGAGCNVFALDFLGIGQSEGDARDIKFSYWKESLLALIGHIIRYHGPDIHLYGGTGTGGIIGQALVSDQDIARHIKTYSQFGVAVFRDLSILGNTLLLRTCHPLIRLLARIAPGKAVRFKVPAYAGLNAAEENAWYVRVMQEYPKAFDFSFALLDTLLSLMLDRHSPLRSQNRCPVLVLAARHDRYYHQEYVERYYQGLIGTKALHWIGSSHLAFLWEAADINRRVIEHVRGNKGINCDTKRPETTLP